MNKMGARSNAVQPPIPDRVNHDKIIQSFFQVVNFDSGMLHYYQHSMNLAIS